MTGAKYQPFNDLSVSDFAALKADIEQRGVLLPIIVDEKDVTIDGHQRRQACAELHIECPRVVLAGLTEDEKMAIAIALNAFRRHLTAGEKSAAVQKLAYLGWSARRIALALGISHQTVLRAQADLDDLPDTRTGADGKPRPSTRPPATGPHGPVGDPQVIDPETGAVLTGSEDRQDPEVSGDESAPDDEGAGSTTHDPAPSDPGVKWRSVFDDALVAAGKVRRDLDPERIVEFASPEQRGRIASNVRALREWCDAVDQALQARPNLKAV